MAAALILWTDEKAWSIQSVNTIVKPKKVYGEIYRRGEAVEARYSGKIYPGVIIDVADQGNRDKLKAKGVRLESYLMLHCDTVLPEEVLEYFELENVGNGEKTPTSDTCTGDEAMAGETCAQGAIQDVVAQFTCAGSVGDTGTKPKDSTEARAVGMRAVGPKAKSTCAGSVQDTGTKPKDSTEARAVSVRAVGPKAKATCAGSVRDTGTKPKDSTEARAVSVRAVGQKDDTAGTKGDQGSVRDYGTGNSSQEQMPSSPDYMSDLSSPIKSRDKRIRSLESEVKELKSDQRALKKKMRRLEERFEEMVSSRSSSAASSGSLQSSVTTVSMTSSAVAQLDDTTELLACVGHLTCSSEKDTQEIVKRLCLKVFTRTELVECSRTGKRSFKSQDSGRPAISSTKMLLLEKAVLEKCPGLTREMFFKKFENIQKMERRCAKKLSE